MAGRRWCQLARGSDCELGSPNYASRFIPPSRASTSEAINLPCAAGVKRGAVFQSWSQTEARHVCKKGSSPALREGIEVADNGVGQEEAIAGQHLMQISCRHLIARGRTNLLLPQPHHRSTVPARSPARLRPVSCAG